MFFQSAPKLLINAELDGLVLAPRLKKGYHQIWEANLHAATPRANVPAFISILGPICNPKMLKVGPKVFLALTPSVNRALKGVG
jgi:hypothetical protein